MPIYKPLFRELVIKYDFKIDLRVIEKILSWKWTIHYNTALKILKEAQEVTWEKYILKDLFYLNELRWYEIERKVIIKNVWRVMNEDDYISIVRYMIEGKWEA